MAETHILTNVSFNSTAITSIVDAQQQAGSLSTSDLKTDAAANLQAHFIDGEFWTITVTTTDRDFGTTFTKGTVASLVVTHKARANGKGVTGSALTSTYGAAVLDDISISASESGQSQVTLTFVATDPSGTGLVTYA